MDIAPIGGLIGGGAAAGMAVGALLMHFYKKGRSDGTETASARSADVSNAAAIMRIEMAVKDLADSIHELSGALNAHLVEDAGNFAHLKTVVSATADAMKEAATQMAKLTERLDHAIRVRP